VPDEAGAHAVSDANKTLAHIKCHRVQRLALCGSEKHAVLCGTNLAVAMKKLQDAKVFWIFGTAG